MFTNIILLISSGLNIYLALKTVKLSKQAESYDYIISIKNAQADLIEKALALKDSYKSQNDILKRVIEEQKKRD